MVVSSGGKGRGVGIGVCVSRLKERGKMAGGQGEWRPAPAGAACRIGASGARRCSGVAGARWHPAGTHLFQVVLELGDPANGVLQQQLGVGRSRRPACAGMGVGSRRWNQGRQRGLPPRERTNNRLTHSGHGLAVPAQAPALESPHLAPAVSPPRLPFPAAAPPACACATSACQARMSERSAAISFRLARSCPR